MAIELEDGTVVLSLPEQVEENKAKVEEVDIKVDNLAARVEAALAGVLHYKGSVATYGDLPADAEIGDVYNVIDTGANYAWTGSEWDELGSVVDLSNCVTLDSAQYIDGVKTFRKTGATPNRAIIRFANTGHDVPFGLDGGEMFSSSSFKPLTSEQCDLGLSSNKWKNLYLSGKIYLYNANNCIEATASYLSLKSSSNIVFNPTYNVLPAADASKDLGSSSYKWKDLYLYGNLSDGTNSVSVANIVTSNTAQTITGDKTLSNNTKLIFNLNAGGTSQATIKGNAGRLEFHASGSEQVAIINNYFYPLRNNAVDLGYPNAFNWKNLYLSGNISDGTNSVTVAELKALIDYAKAQGWIS